MMHLHTAVHPRPQWLLVAGALLGATGCCPKTPRPTPAPRFASFAAASRADLLTYARSLQFDTVQPAMDAQYLVYGDSAHLQVGPFAQLAPEIGAGSISAAALRAGRILARIVLDGPFPAGSLSTGATYVWVDSTPHGFRSIFVPESDSAPIREWTLETRPAVKDSTEGHRARAWFFERFDALTLNASYNCDWKICTSSEPVH
jgi:hypothetical protein